MKALGIALFVFSMAYGAQKVKLSANQLTQIGNSLKEIGESYAKEDATSRRLKLGQHKEDLMDIVDGLYLDGHVTLEQFKEFESQIDAGSAAVMCDADEPEDCGNYLKTFFVNFHATKVKNKEPTCKSPLENATAGQCCNPNTYHKMPFVTFNPAGSCEQAGNSCTDHGDCCSNVCGSNGTCAPALSCYKLNKKGQECPVTNPYCESGCPMNDDSDPTNDDPTCKPSISCMSINFNSTGVGECKANGLACSTNTDCCSDKCSSGQCVPKSICTDCARMGQEAKGRSCCPGTFLGTNGRCIQDFPPFTLPTSSVSPNIFEKLIGLIIPSAHAVSTEQAECPDVFEGKTSQQWYNQKLQETLSSYTNPTEAQVQEAMAQAAAAKREKEREHAGCLAKNGGVGEGKILTRSEYQKLYNMPNILSKTYSDVKKCEFNTLNDSWRAKSYTARNAEIALMAFEATYSGLGHDMIVSGRLVDQHSDSHGKNIFKRAQDIANQLRKNRSESIDEYQELDIKMTCKCLAVFGPQNFNTDKQKFFLEQCPSEHAYVTEEHIRGSGDGENLSGKVEEKTEIDKGAVGISHEKLMVEWLGLRRDVQYKKFEENEKLEEEFLALSKFISEYPWYNPPGNPSNYQKVEKLYTFYTWKWKGWVMFVLAVIAIAAAVYFGPMAFSSLGSVSVFGLGALTSAGVVGLAGGVLWASLSGLFNSNGLDPDVRDVKVGSGCWKKVLGLCIQSYKKYDRYLDWPYFNSDFISSAKDPKYKCEVYGQSTSCVKSVYLSTIKYSNGNPDEDVVVENNPLLDVALPITVEKDAYDYEQVRQGKTYAELINNRYTNYGLPAMKATKSEFKRKGSKYYTKEKTYKGEMLPRPLTSREELMKKFAIDEGSWVPKNFSDVGKAAFKNGIVLYARCKQLEKCARHSKELLGETQEERSKAYGFGHLFEDDKDAKIFAEYAYQMHLVWPRLSADSRVGYPTLGMDAYFQAMAYNLRLHGSLALRRSYELGEAYDLYKADWEKRKSDYKGLGGAEEGDGSKNVTPGERVWSAIKTLDFKNHAEIAAMPSKIEGLEKSGKFDSTQLNALSAIKRHAIREADAQAKREHYDKNYGNTERGKRKVASSQSFIKKFNTPLDKMAMPVGGVELGGLNNMPETKSTASDQKTASVKRKTTKEYDQTSRSSYSSSYRGSFGTKNSQYNMDQEDDTESGQELSTQEAAAMIHAANGDGSLEEALPSDTLFTVVSKAYKRNLSRVLVYRLDEKTAIPEREVAPKVELKDKSKQELKQLLDAN